MEPTERPRRSVAPKRNPGTRYAAAYGIAAAGGAFGFLGATGAATEAGAPARGAIATGVLLALYQLSAAMATPYVPRICRFVGPRVAFARLQGASAGLWCTTGVALLLGAPSLPVLLVAAVPVGFAGGLMAVLRPILAQCYFGARNMSRAIATMSVIVGVAWAAGALLGGWLLSSAALGWGLVIYGLTSMVLAATVSRVGPALEPAAPRATTRAWHAAWTTLKNNRVVRWSAVLGATGALCITPIAGLVVPIAHSFRAGRPLSGASFLMASFSIGQLCSPIAVRGLARRRAELPAGALATALCGGALVALGVVSALLAHAVGELAVWVVIGILFGATRFASGALYFGAAAESGPESDASCNLATVALISLLMAPVGVLVCSAVLGSVSAEVAVLLSGAGASVVGSFVMRASGHSSAGGPEGAR